jgi:hypothetical protein
MGIKTGATITPCACCSTPYLCLAHLTLPLLPAAPSKHPPPPLQDLQLHQDEVHSKLVDIMRERLGLALTALPGELAAGAAAGPPLTPPGPSPCMVALGRQVGGAGRAWMWGLGGGGEGWRCRRKGWRGGGRGREEGVEVGAAGPPLTPPGPSPCMVALGRQVGGAGSGCVGVWGGVREEGWGGGWAVQQRQGVLSG